MKKIIIILTIFITPFFIFPESVTTLEECNIALTESNDLLIKALNKISELERKNSELTDNLKAKKNIESEEIIKNLEDTNQRLRVSLAEASNSLKESNMILEKAYKRIEEDQKEIELLRKRIKELIEAGVEVKTYNWSTTILFGYPYEIGFDFNYNLPWMPILGVVIGSNYNIESGTPEIKAGIRINI